MARLSDRLPENAPGDSGTASKDPVRDAVGALPDPILSDVLYCGYASESSYGAASYLVVRESGNVLVDTNDPRRRR
jgi:hypothetical protein